MRAWRTHPRCRSPGLRLLLGGIALFAVVIVWNKPLLPSRLPWPWLIVLALAASTFAFGSMFLAPRYTGAGVAAVLGNTQPLIAIVKRVAGGTDLLMLSVWQLSLGAVPLLAASLASERATDLVWAPEFLGLLAFLSLAGTAFLTVAWYVLIRTGELGRLSLAFFLVPSFGLGLAAWLLGDTVSPTQVVGLVLVVAALAAAASPPSRANRASGPGNWRRPRTASDGSDGRA